MTCRSLLAPLELDRTTYPRLANSCKMVVFSSRAPDQPGKNKSTGYRSRRDESAAFNVALVRTQRAAERKRQSAGKWPYRRQAAPRQSLPE